MVKFIKPNFVGDLLIQRRNKKRRKNKSRKQVNASSSFNLVECIPTNSEGTELIQVDQNMKYAIFKGSYTQLITSY